jgi:CRP-like cAMP-binding protein
MPRVSSREHSEIRIRATRGWPRSHGEDGPHLEISASQRADLARLAEVIEYKTAGSKIFSQGGEAAFIYLLVDGLTRICHTHHNGDRQILAFHWPGDLFGLEEHGKYLNSAETITKATVNRFPVKKLEAFLLENPLVQEGFLVKAMHDLRRSQRQLLVMGRYDIPHRLAAFLLDCSAHGHYFDRAAQVLTLPMSRYDIADYLGTSAETITRAFGRLESEGTLRRLTARRLEMKTPELKAVIEPD